MIWSGRLRDFRGCCKPVLCCPDSVGIDRHSLVGWLVEAILGATRLEPATGWQSSTRFDGHVWSTQTRPSTPENRSHLEGTWGVWEWVVGQLGRLLVGLSLVRPTASEESKWDNWPSGAVVDWPWRPLVHHKSKWLRDSVTRNQAVTSHQRGLFRLGCLFFAARWQHLPTSSSPADLSLTDTRVLGGVRLKAASILLKVLILGSINLRPSFDFDPTLIIGWRSWSWIPFPGCDLGLLLPRVPWSDRTVALTTLHPLPFHSFGPSNLAPAPHHFFNYLFSTLHLFLHHTTFSITFIFATLHLFSNLTL